MTDETFAKGLNLYLTGKYLRSATPQDFYEFMQKALDEDQPDNTIDISAFMNPWIMQAGYPIVSVSRENDALTITQERYHQNTVEDTTGTIWKIPLTYATASFPDFNDTTPDLWMDEVSKNIDNLTAKKTWTENDWVLFNIQETGYYRVNYDLNLWKLLSDELYRGDYTKIHVANRAQLIDDSFNLARSQRLEYKVPFDILNYLINEDDYIPWAAADRALSFLHPYLIGSNYYDHFQSMMRYGSNLFYTRLGVKSIVGEPPLDVLGRNLAINWACSMGHPKCISDTTFLMDQVAQDEITIASDLETTVYCNGLRGASQKTFESMWKLVFNPDKTVYKTLILSSLGCSHDSALLKSYLESSIDQTLDYEEFDRVQVISAVYSNGGLLGLNLALDFLETTNAEVLEK